MRVAQGESKASADREANLNNRMCLTKATTAHISDKEKQESFIKAVIKLKPKDRHTLPGDLSRYLRPTISLSPMSEQGLLITGVSDVSAPPKGSKLSFR